MVRCPDKVDVHCYTFLSGFCILFSPVYLCMNIFLRLVLHVVLRSFSCCLSIRSCAQSTKSVHASMDKNQLGDFGTYLLDVWAATYAMEYHVNNQVDENIHKKSHEKKRSKTVQSHTKRYSVSTFTYVKLAFTLKIADLVKTLANTLG